MLYVEELIGPATVNTMPIETIDAFLTTATWSGRSTRTWPARTARMQLIEEQGISIRQVTDELIDEGVAAFGKSFDEPDRHHRQPAQGARTGMTDGPLDAAITDRLATWEREGVADRLWAKDGSLWADSGNAARDAEQLARLA